MASPSARTNEFTVLQQEITNEIGRDAPEIAKGVFGDNANHPDMASVSNQQLDDLYRQKFQAQDRQWLQGEARRDPQQFLDVSKRIGVTMPDPNAPPTPKITSPQVQQMLATALQPQAGPGPAAPVGLPAAAPALPPPPVSPAMPLAPAAGGMVPGGQVATLGSVVPPPGPAAPPPVILGPNGQPLPPSGALG